MSETAQELKDSMLSRLRAMATDKGDTWDLSPKDQAAIQYALDQVEQLTESVRVAAERVTDLENGLTTLHLQFGEPYYSWQRVLYRVQQLIRRRNACAEACLNAIGFLDGLGTIKKEALTQRLVDAVQPIVSGKDELPEFKQVATSPIRTAESIGVVLEKVGAMCLKASEEDHETQRDLFCNAVDMLEPLVIEYRDLLAAVATK
jgi:hypothetical protein